MWDRCLFELTDYKGRSELISIKQIESIRPSDIDASESYTMMMVSGRDFTISLDEYNKIKAFLALNRPHNDRKEPLPRPGPGRG